MSRTNKGVPDLKTLVLDASYRTLAYDLPRTFRRRFAVITVPLVRLVDALFFRGTEGEEHDEDIGQAAASTQSEFRRWVRKE